MTILYPIKYQDSVDLEGDSDDIITLLTPPEQRMLQSILNNVESNPEIFIADYLEQDTDVVDAFLADLMIKLMGITLSEVVPTRRQRLFADGYNALTGALSWSSQPTLFNAGFYVLAPAINNFVRWDYISLKKGIYQAELLGRKTSAAGIVNLKFDGVTETTIDMYNSTTQNNQKVLSGSFQLDNDGVYTVVAQMATKNASSSNYGLDFNWIDLYRTSEL